MLLSPTHTMPCSSLPSILDYPANICRGIQIMKLYSLSPRKHSLQNSVCKRSQSFFSSCMSSSLISLRQQERISLIHFNRSVPNRSNHTKGLCSQHVRLKPDRADRLENVGSWHLTSPWASMVCYKDNFYVFRYQYEDNRL